MIKIKGKKAPPELTFMEHILPNDGRYWHCGSHQVIFEFGEKVLIDGKGSLHCPLEGCKKYALTNADKKWWEETYELDGVLK